MADGQRAAAAQKKSNKPSNAPRFMNPFDSCIFFPCGLQAEEMPSQPFPAAKYGWQFSDKLRISLMILPFQLSKSQIITFHNG